MDISIILCTYNPDQDSFLRSIKAICGLIIPEGKEVELIVVDNNSSPPIAALVEKYIPISEIKLSVKVVSEPTPGLLYARKKGFETSIGEIIVFFDDDNEPDQNYLTEVQRIMGRFS